MVRVNRRSRWVSAFFMTALSALATQCGGQSTVKGSGGKAGSEQGVGGTGATGGRNGTGGSGGGVSTGGTGMGALGGSAGTGGSGVAAFGGTAVGTGGSGVAGAPQGDAFAHCMPRPLVYGAACSFEDACDALDCGAPWALQREDGCLRRTCFSDLECPMGQRCIAAPIAGAYDDFFSSGCESCEYVEGTCSCSCFDDASRRAVCLTTSELPPSEYCPTAGLSCDELFIGVVRFGQYIDDGRFAGDLLERLDECRQKFFAVRTETCLVGQGGAGGEGGGN